MLRDKHILIAIISVLTFMHLTIVQLPHYKYRAIKHTQVLSNTSTPVAQINGRLLIPASAEAITRTLVAIGVKQETAFNAAYTTLSALLFTVTILLVYKSSSIAGATLMGLLWFTTFVWYKYAPWSVAEPALVAVGVWMVRSHRFRWLPIPAILIFFNRYSIGTETIKTTEYNQETAGMALLTILVFFCPWLMLLIKRWVIIPVMIVVAVTLIWVYWIESTRLWMSMMPVVIPYALDCLQKRTL